MPIWTPSTPSQLAQKAVMGSPISGPGVRVESDVASALALASQNVRFEGSLGLIPLKAGELRQGAAQAGNFYLFEDTAVDPARGTVQTQSLAADVGNEKLVTVGSIGVDFDTPANESVSDMSVFQTASETPTVNTPADLTALDPNGGDALVGANWAYVATGQGYVPIAESPSAPAAPEYTPPPTGYGYDPSAPSTDYPGLTNQDIVNAALIDQGAYAPGATSDYTELTYIPGNEWGF